MIKKEVFDRIRTEVTNNNVVLYMKGTPMYPKCGFSSALVQILEALDVSYTPVNTMEDPSLYDAIQEYSSWPSIPQLYVKGEFVGNGETVRDMYTTGKLAELFKKVEILK